jgi:hypothetical protein
MNKRPAITTSATHGGVISATEGVINVLLGL